MRYFLTGATGFLGGRLARLLVDEGHGVTALARDPSRAKNLAALGVDLHAGDLADPLSLVPPMLGVDGVFHVAGWYKVGSGDLAAARRVNVEGTRNVLDAMERLQVPKGVYTSSLAVFSDTGGRVVDESYRPSGEWLSAYDRSKADAHFDVADPAIARGLPLVVLQPGVIYGPGDASLVHDLLDRFLRRKLPAVPAKSAYCWMHVEDAARAHLLAMERGRAGETYVTAGPPATVVEVVALASKITGVPAPRAVSPRTLRTVAALTRLVEWVLPLPDAYRSESLRVSAGATYLGTSAKAERELGFRARPIAEGLAETLAWEKERIAAG